jgi:hypothetical protein
MKLKEFFTKRGTQGKITDEAYTKFLETIQDSEIPDEIDGLLEEKFMTAERASTDSKIMGKARADVYSIVDERIKGILPAIEKVDKTLVIDIDAEKDTLKKISKLGPALDKVASKASNSEETEKVKELEKQKTDLLGKIKTLNDEKENEVKTLRDTFENEKKSIHLDIAMGQEFDKIDLAPEHKELSGAIKKIVLADLKAQSFYSLGESGQIDVSILENGVPKPKFKGNTQVTFKEELEEKVKPYIKRSTAGDVKTKPEPTRHNSQPSTTGMTLKEMRAAEYAAKA